VSETVIWKIILFISVRFELLDGMLLRWESKDKRWILLLFTNSFLFTIELSRPIEFFLQNCIVLLFTLTSFTMQLDRLIWAIIGGKRRPKHPFLNLLPCLQQTSQHCFSAFLRFLFPQHSFWILL
jgi:hypothetical protein